MSGTVAAIEVAGEALSLLIKLYPAGAAIFPILGDMINGNDVTPEQLTTLRTETAALNAQAQAAEDAVIHRDDPQPGE